MCCRVWDTTTTSFVVVWSQATMLVMGWDPTTTIAVVVWDPRRHYCWTKNTIISVVVSTQTTNVCGGSGPKHTLCLVARAPNHTCVWSLGTKPPLYVLWFGSQAARGGGTQQKKHTDTQTCGLAPKATHICGFALKPQNT